MHQYLILKTSTDLKLPLCIKKNVEKFALKLSIFVSEKKINFQEP